MRLGNFGSGNVGRTGVVLALVLGSLAASPALAAASAPTVTAVTPTIGRTSGNTAVGIRGNEFNSVIAVYFGSTPAKSFTVNDREAISAVSPPAAGPGTVAITVETAEGVSEAGAGSSFTYREPPEFGACVKLGFGNGSFTASGCQTEQRSTFGNSEFEWFAAFGSSRPLEKRGIALTAPKGMTLETVGRTQVKCAAGSASAEYAAPKSIALGAMTFTGCASRTLGTCEGAGAAAGELSLQPLMGTLGVTELKTGEKAAVGLDLAPTSGEMIAEFTCGGTPVSVRGDVIIGLKAPDKMVEKTKWVAGESGGMPKTSFFIGGPEAVLETSVGAGEYERSGLKLNATGLNESVKVEISTKI